MFSQRFGFVFSEGLTRLQAYRDVSSQIIENELIAYVNCNAQKLVRWKQGYLPIPQEVEKLIVYFKEQHYFNNRYIDILRESALAHTSESSHQDINSKTKKIIAPHISLNLPDIVNPLLKSRESDLEEVLQGLQSRWRIVVIKGLSGSGKSALAIHAAHKILELEPYLFKWIVYITGKSHKITLNLFFNSIINSLSSTWVGILNNERESLIPKMIQLLREERILILLDDLDNFDEEVAAFLYNVPEPSKLLIVTQRSLFQHAWMVELKGIKEKEAIQIVKAQIRENNLHSQWHNDTLSPTIQQLIVNTDGSPFISKILPACVMAANRPTRKFFWNWDLYNQELRSGIKTAPEVALELLAGLWHDLPEAQKEVLQSFTLFMDFADSDALAATAGIHPPDKIQSILEELYKLGLVDKRVSSFLSAPPRYTVHSLMIEFLKSVSSSRWQQAASERWLTWYEGWITTQDETEWSDERARRLESANLFAVLEYLDAHPDALTRDLAHGLHRYLTFQGRWKQVRDLSPIWEERFKPRRPSMAFWLKSHTALIKIEQNDIQEAIQDLKMILDEADVYSFTLPDHKSMLNYTKVLLHLGQAYLARHGSNDLKKINYYFAQGIDIALSEGDNPNVIRLRYQQAVTKLRYGDIPTAVKELKTLLQEEQYQTWNRAKGYIVIRLAESLIALGHLEEAERYLALYHDKIASHDEQLLSAYQLMMYAYLESERGNFEPALLYTNDAIDIFERFNHAQQKEAIYFRKRLRQSLEHERSK